MAATELAEISRSIKSALGESSGGFRKAANDNNAVIGKLNRDLGRYFASMKSQLSEISETNSEIAQNTEKLVSKTDKFSSVLSESVSIQNQLYNEMRNVVSGVKVLNGGIGQLQNSVAGPGTSTLLGKIGLVVDGVTSSVGFLSRIATIAGAGYLIGKETGMIGGGESGAGGNTGGGYAPVSGASGSWSKDKEFLAEVERVSKKFDIKSNDLLSVMARESGIDPQARNKDGGATGLIQFIPSTARGLGTSTEALYGMNRAQQMKWVETYLEKNGLRKGASAEEIYATIFLPAKAKQDVLAVAGSKEYSHNRGLDTDHDGRITKADLLRELQTAGKKHGVGSIGSNIDISSTSSTDTTSSTPKPENQPTPNASGVTPQSTPLHLQQPEGAHGGMMSGAGHAGHNHDVKPQNNAGSMDNKGLQLTTLQTKSGKSFQVNSQYADRFKAFVDDLESTGYKIRSIGGYRNTYIENNPAKGKSWHAKGMAIDINPDANPVTYRGQPGAGKNDLPENIGAIAARHGLGWGGNWRNKLDTMHFSFGSNEGGKSSGGSSGGNVNGSPITPSMGGGQSTGGTGGGGETSSGTGGQESPAAQISPAAVSGLTGGAISSLGDIASEATSISGMGSLSGMMGGFEGVSGALGGMGIGMNTGSLLSAFGSAMESNAPQMMPTPSQTSMNVEQLNNEAVINEAMNQINSERAAQNAVIKAEEDNNLYNANIREGMPIASDYNRPEDKMLAPEWMHGIEYRGYREFNPLKYG